MTQTVNYPFQTRAQLAEKLRRLAYDKGIQDRRHREHNNPYDKVAQADMHKYWAKGYAGQPY